MALLAIVLATAIVHVIARATVLARVRERAVSHLRLLPPFADHFRRVGMTLQAN